MFWATDGMGRDDFLVREGIVEISERGNVRTLEVVYNGEEFCFLQPLKWNITTDSAERSLNLLCEDKSAAIVVTFTKMAEVEENEIEKEGEKEEEEDETLTLLKQIVLKKKIPMPN